MATQQTAGSSVYAFKITTPPNTAAASPLESYLALEKGFLSQARLRIPGGHAGLTGLALFDDSGQIIPKVTATWFFGDDEIIEYPFDVDVPNWDGSYKLQAKTYNTDDTFPHSHYLYLYVVGYPA